MKVIERSAAKDSLEMYGVNSKVANLLDAFIDENGKISLEKTYSKVQEWKEFTGEIKVDTKELEEKSEDDFDSKLDDEDEEWDN